MFKIEQELNQERFYKISQVIPLDPINEINNTNI